MCPVAVLTPQSEKLYKVYIYIYSNIFNFSASPSSGVEICMSRSINSHELAKKSPSSEMGRFFPLSVTYPVVFLWWENDCYFNT